MKTEQELKDEYLLYRDINFPDFKSKINLNNLVLTDYFEDAIFSHESIDLNALYSDRKKLIKDKELERQQTIEKEEHESAYFFTLICLEKSLVSEINEIKRKQFTTEDSRQKSLKPYIKRLNAVRDKISPIEKKVTEIKKRYRLPSSLVRAVAECLRENPKFKTPEVFRLIYNCSMPENDDEFYRLVTIQSCSGCSSDSIFYWLDNEKDKPKAKPMKRTSFDGVVTKAKRYNRENYSIT